MYVSSGLKIIGTMRIFVVILFIFIDLVEIRKCEKNNVQEIEEPDKNSLKFAMDVKKEIISESDADRNVFVNVMRRKRSRRQREIQVSSKSYHSTNFKQEIMISKSDADRSVFVNIMRGKRSRRQPGIQLSSKLYCSMNSTQEIKCKNLKVAEKPYDGGNYCEHCNIHFRLYSLYEEHCRKKHQNEKPYTCPYCHISHAVRHNSVNHQLLCHPDKVCHNSPRRKLKNFTCELCNKKIKGANALQIHVLKDHKGTKTKKCADCAAEFFRIGDLNRHRHNKHRSRNTDDFFRCKSCYNIYERSDVLESHMAICQRKDEIKKRMMATRVRLKTSIDATDLQEPIKRRINCYECGVKLPSAKKLKEHMHHNHPEVKKIFSCDQCKMSFCRIQYFEKHIDKFHPDLEEMKPKKYMKQMKYICHVCADEFSGLDQYQGHVKTSHPDEKPFRCATCGDGFWKKSVLAEHSKRVHGPKKFPCLYCRKCFGLKNDWKKHEKSCGKAGANKEVFFCDICMKWLKGTSKGHKYNHDDFDHCAFCGQRFHKYKNPKGLLNHINRRHPNNFNDDNGDGLNVLLNAADIMNSLELKMKQEGCDD